MSFTSVSMKKRFGSGSELVSVSMIFQLRLPQSAEEGLDVVTADDVQVTSLSPEPTV